MNARSSNDLVGNADYEMKNDSQLLTFECAFVMDATEVSAPDECGSSKLSHYGNVLLTSQTRTVVHLKISRILSLPLCYSTNSDEHISSEWKFFFFNIYPLEWKPDGLYSFS